MAEGGLIQERTIEMRNARVGSMLGLAAVAASMALLSPAIIGEREFRSSTLPKSYRKPSRAPDRSKKQYLIKGLRP